MLLSAAGTVPTILHVRLHLKRGNAHYGDLRQVLPAAYFRFGARRVLKVTVCTVCGLIVTGSVVATDLMPL